MQVDCVPVKVTEIFRWDIKSQFIIYMRLLKPKDKERLKVKGSEKYTREIITVRQNRLFGKKRELLHNKVVFTRKI